MCITEIRFVHNVFTCILGTPLDLLQGHDAFQYLVVSCPPLDALLQPGDQVYVIHACPAEALGLLFASDS